MLTLAWLVAVVLLPTGVGGALMGLKESWAGRFAKRLRRPAAEATPETTDAGATPETTDAEADAETAVAPAAPAAGGSDTAWRINAIPERTAPLPRPVANRPLLQVQGIKRSFGGVHAVRGVTFDVRQGEVVGIIGPNGAGKTTLFEIIAGFTDPDGGSVTFNGKPVTKLSPQARAGLGLARSFQDARLFSTLTRAGDGDDRRRADRAERPRRGGARRPRQRDRQGGAGPGADRADGPGPDGRQAGR